MINILELDCSKGWGGQEKRTIRLINGLDKSKFRVFFGVFKDSQIAKRKDEIDANIIPISIYQSYDLIALAKIVSAIKRYKIDIISTHSGKDGWLGAIAGKLTNIPVVRTRHLLTKINSNISYNLSTKVVAVSQAVRDYLIKAGVKSEKIELIYTGVDTNLFKPNSSYSLKDELKLPKDAILVGIVAVLRVAKNHQLLIRAIKELPELYLAIIGTGPQEKNLKELINSLSLQNRVFMLGHRDDIASIMPSLDIFVLPSREEALGTAILEASACGVACIGSKIGGICECIDENRSGLLFESDNLEDLKSKLKLLSKQKELRAFFGKNARELILERFSNEVMIKKTEELYEKLLKR